MRQIHPQSKSLRLIRSLRGLQRVRGWRRLASIVAPEHLAGHFLVVNRAHGKNTYFAGDASSFIDRQMYLFGNYEGDQISAFLSLVPAHKRRVALDIGANVGTHSIAFAQNFSAVHAFEPNSSLWGSFERNRALNQLTNVTLHKVGLADRDDELRLFLIAKKNYGLGTFSTLEQYDLPLQEFQTAKVAAADQYLALHKIENVDAIKIDVQGFEPEVLRGLRKTLEKNCPFVWFEVGRGAQLEAQSVEAVSDFFPYDFELFQLTPRPSSALHSLKLTPISGGSLADGEYIVAPHVVRNA